MNKNKKRNIIIGSLCTIVLLMAVGYAAFNTVLNIQGTSNITSNWNIKITDVTTKNIKGTASNKEEPTFKYTSATFKTSLESPGDSLEYEVTVTNAGNLNAKVDEVTLSDTNNPAIKFTSSGITKGDIINAGSTRTLLIKVEYLESVTSQPENAISDLNISLEFVQTMENEVAGAMITVIDSSGFPLVGVNINLAGQACMTNPLGQCEFTDLELGVEYILNIRYAGYSSFSPNSFILYKNGITDINITANRSSGGGGGASN